MFILSQQYKLLIIFLLSAAVLGAVIGIFRDDWFHNPDILLSNSNPPESKKEFYEDKIISEHNMLIADQVKDGKVKDLLNDQSVTLPAIVNSVAYNSEDNCNIKKTESIKKNVTKNTSGLININSASKEDFMSLPYFGEYKAGRIIQLTNEMGVFTSIKDLEKVKGIGPKTLTKIEPFITL